MRQAEIYNLNPGLMQFTLHVLQMAKIEPIANELRAEFSRSYVILDQLLRFDSRSGEPELVLTVRTAKAPVQKIFTSRQLKAEVASSSLKPVMSRR